MIQITDIPTEQNTAATDALLAILRFIITGEVYKSGEGIDLKKTRIWTWYSVTYSCFGTWCSCSWISDEQAHKTCTMAAFKSIAYTHHLPICRRVV